MGAGGIAALVPLMTGGQTERQRSFAHACLSNLAIDQFIKAKIVAVASSGSETQRAREFVSKCWSKGELEVDEAVIQAKIHEMALGETPAAAPATSAPAPPKEDAGANVVDVQ